MVHIFLNGLLELRHCPSEHVEQLSHNVKSMRLRIRVSVKKGYMYWILQMVNHLAAAMMISAMVLSALLGWTCGQKLPQDLDGAELQLNALTDRVVRLTDKLGTLQKDREAASYGIRGLDKRMDRFLGLYFL